MARLLNRNIKSFVTIQDVLREKHLAELEEIAREEAQAAKEATKLPKTPTDPRVGYLIRNGLPVYYVNFPYRESKDLAALEASLPPL